MRLLLIFTLLLLAKNLSHAGDKDLIRVRELYYKASSNKNGAEMFDNFLSSSPDITKSLLDGYKGMSYMIRANYFWNPYNKFSYFNKGKDLLNEAIRKDPEKMELRFLRFLAQTNAPDFLGYNGNIAEDKALILNNYFISKDSDLKNRIKTYLTKSKYCTLADRALLK